MLELYKIRLGRGKFCYALITWLCCILAGSTAKAQTLNFKFKHITNDQGLSNSTIEAIYQDSRGFIWFGTRDGLNRYDGYNIKVFKNRSGDAESISNNYIRCINEDARHRLWIGTTNGLNLFNASKNSFVQYKHNPTQGSSLSGNDVTCIYTDSEGKLWIGTNGSGLNLFDDKTNSFRLFKNPADKRLNTTHDTINCLLEDSRHLFWAGTNKGISVFSKKQAAVSPFIDPRLIKNPVLRIQEDKRGNIWIGTFANGLMMANRAAGQLKEFHHDLHNPFSISSEQIRSLLADDQGNVWLGGINGSLDLYQPLKNNFIHAKNEPDNPLSLSQATVSSIFMDNQHNLWVGVHRGGVNFYSPQADKFQLIQKTSNPDGLSYNDIKGFYQDHKGQIWISTDLGGLNLYNPQDNTFKHFRYNVNNSRSISSNAVLGVNEDKDNQLWIGTWGGGINLFDPKTNSFKHFVNNPSDRSSISSNYVQGALLDSEGNFWVGTYYGGLDLLNTKTRKFTRITSDPLKQTSIYGNNIVSLNEDKEKNVWIGTDDGGLNCYNLVKKHFTHYFVNGEKTPDVRVIFTDSKGRVWAGQYGLYLFDKARNNFFSYTDQGGLSSIFIKGITEDESGNLWISTSNGLVKFNPQTYQLHQYNTADGLQGSEFEAGAYLKTRSGEMYFGGVNGFNRFYPKNIRLNTFTAPVYITAINVQDQPLEPGKKGSPLKNDITLTHDLTLDHSHSTLSFEFAILNYSAPQNNQYAYKLQDLDNDWHYSGTDHNAHYSSLDPGNYTFYVKAANKDGVWNSQVNYIHVHIKPPFWATWWFRGIVLLIISTALYRIFQFKKNLDLRKIEEQRREEMHHVQLQFFTNISHEFRTPLSLILGPLEKMMKEDKRPDFELYYDTIHRNANRLLLLINELMDFRKAETGALGLKVMPGNLISFIHEITDDFQSLALQKQINFEVIVPEQIENSWFDRQILEKIVLNLLDNAFKYSTANGSVAIELYTDSTGFRSVYPHSIAANSSYKGSRYVYIRVSDKGIGISSDSIHHLFERYYRITDSHLGSGVGLAFVRSLTMIHKGSIQVFSERNTGTDFIIALPVDKADYEENERWVNQAGVGIQLESITAPFYTQKTEGLIHGYINHNVQKENRPHTILIVDDNVELRNFLHHSLDEFYQVIEASDGAGGLQQTTEHLPDLIVSDLMMPVMNGMEFCRKVKSDPVTGQIPFIILTAKDSLDAKIEGADAGADVYFPKPVSVHLLLITINNILQQRRVLKERSLKNYFLEAQEIAGKQTDKAFMDQLIKLIESQLSNSELDVEFLCREMGMSKTKLYHRIKNVSGYSIGEFVRTFRLKKAADIIAHEDVLLTDVMYRVGIQTQSYFTKAFKKEFGKTPSQFLQEIKRPVQKS